jgi:hypothetical protein
MLFGEFCWLIIVERVMGLDVVVGVSGIYLV